MSQELMDRLPWPETICYTVFQDKVLLPNLRQLMSLHERRQIGYTSFIIFLITILSHAPKCQHKLSRRCQATQVHWLCTDTPETLICYVCYILLVEEQIFSTISRETSAAPLLLPGYMQYQAKESSVVRF